MKQAPFALCLPAILTPFGPVSGYPRGRALLSCSGRLVCLAHALKCTIAAAGCFCKHPSRLSCRTFWRWMAESPAASIDGVYRPARLTKADSGSVPTVCSIEASQPIQSANPFLSSLFSNRHSGPNRHCPPIAIHLQSLLCGSDKCLRFLAFQPTESRTACRPSHVGAPQQQTEGACRGSFSDCFTWNTCSVRAHALERRRSFGLVLPAFCTIWALARLSPSRQWLSVPSR